MEVKLRLRERLGIKLLKKHTLGYEFTPCNDGSHLGCLAVKVDDCWYKIISKVAGMDARKLFSKWVLSTRHLEGREN